MREKSLRAQLASLRAANERMDRELASLRRDSEAAAAEAEATAASSALEEHLSESGFTESESRATHARSPSRPASPAPRSEETRAMAELPLALERAARAEARAAQVEVSRAAAVASAAEERRALTAAKEAAAKEVEWLKAARERLLREVATLRSSNVAVERDLRLSHERVAMLEEDARENYGAVSGLEKKLHEATRRAEDLEEKKARLERDRKLHEERTAAAIAAAEASHSVHADQGARDADLDATARLEREAARERASRAALERELEEVSSSKRALEAETRALRALVESRDEASANARAQATRAQEDVRLARERNVALSRELAQAREELLAAREDATLSPAKTQIAEALREEVDRLAARVKEAYVREAELKRQLAAVARAALEKAASETREASAEARGGTPDENENENETGGGDGDAARTDPAEASVSAPAASKPALAAFLAAATSLSRGEDARAPGVADDFRRRLAEDETRARRLAEEGDESGGVPGDDRRPLSTNPNPKLKRFLSSAFENAPPEKRYKAKRRAVDVLCAAAKPAAGATGGADADPEARASHLRVARRSLAAAARVMRRGGFRRAQERRAAQRARAHGGGAQGPQRADLGVPRDRRLRRGRRALHHAKRSPSFAGGGALRAAAAALRRHGAEDASAARAAARAMWTAVHLGGRAAQEEMFLSDGAHTVAPLLTAMRAHAEDASVTEACCGCLLASALGFGPGQDALAASGARTAIEDATRAAAERGHPMRFGGAFAGLEQWIDVQGL